MQLDSECQSLWLPTFSAMAQFHISGVLDQMMLATLKGVGLSCLNNVCHLHHLIQAFLQHILIIPYMFSLAGSPTELVPLVPHSPSQKFS